MRLLLSTTLIMSVSLSAISEPALAHHPDKENQRVHPRIEVIPPLGNNLPMSYRRKYNRPQRLVGKLMYHIAPSSQEAMAWHRATHLGYYKNHAPRMVTHYFYPKPWEALRNGANKSVDNGEQEMQIPSAYGSGGSEAVPPPSGDMEDPAATESSDLPGPAVNEPAPSPSDVVPTEATLIEENLIEETPVEETPLPSIEPETPELPLLPNNASDSE